MGQELDRKSMYLALQDKSKNKDWKETRIAYLARGNGEIITAKAKVTSITNHGRNVNVVFPESAQSRTYRDCLCMMVADGEDRTFKRAKKIYVG